MPMPRADAESRAFFDSLIPEEAGVHIRPMFGNLAGFINGHMFAGVFGADVFVRLPEAERTELLSAPGAAPFAPLEGRPLKEYVLLPSAWRDDPERARDWVARSLEWAASLPARERKPRRQALERTPRRAR